MKVLAVVVAFTLLITAGCATTAPRVIQADPQCLRKGSELLGMSLVDRDGRTLGVIDNAFIQAACLEIAQEQQQRQREYNHQQAWVEAIGYTIGFLKRFSSNMQERTTPPAPVMIQPAPRPVPGPSFCQPIAGQPRTLFCY